MFIGDILNTRVNDAELNEVVPSALWGVQSSGEVVQTHQSAQGGIKENMKHHQSEKQGGPVLS